VNVLTPTAQMALTYLLPLVTLAFMWYQPAALQLSFFITGLYSSVQSAVFRNPRFRDWAGITPIAAAPNQNAASPSQGGVVQNRTMTASTKSSTETSGVIGKAIGGLRSMKDSAVQQARK
jgi:YidC/Oxa1 family membrane protein insertase